MNRRLQDPFQSLELPECIEEFLEDGVARTIAFNHHGTLLAAGCEDGRVVIWDFETRGVARAYAAHRQAVTCVAWSRDGRFVASSSFDKIICLWNVAANEQEGSVEVETAAVMVSLNRRDPHALLASFQSGPPQLVNFDTMQIRPLPSLILEPDSKAAKAGAAPGAASALGIFDAHGMLLYVGHSKTGSIAVLDADSQRFMDVIKVPNAPRILGLALNRRGTQLVVNCSDRAVRVFDTHRPAPGRRFPTPAELRARASAKKAHGSHIQTLQTRSALIGVGQGGRGAGSGGGNALLSGGREFSNVVERTPWVCAAFTGDGEHVAAAAAAPDEHRVHVWSAAYGKLERVLEGPNEGCIDMAWHPGRNALVTVAAGGRILVWAHVYKENWTAFAPDFRELEHNETVEGGRLRRGKRDTGEYVEREDEFDVNPRPDSSGAPGPEDDIESSEVDVTTLEEAALESSDEEGEEALVHLPVEIERQKMPAPAGSGLEEGDGNSSGHEESSSGAADGASEGSEDADVRLGEPLPGRRRSHPTPPFDKDGDDAAGPRQRKARLKVRFNGGGEDERPDAKRQHGTVIAERTPVLGGPASLLDPPH